MAKRTPPTIAGGAFRGRELRVAGEQVTRPMRTRVREALFARLGDHVEGAVVLDLYAGAGSLGLEALSRGARRCTFVERDRRALAALRSNLATVGLARDPERAVLVAANAQIFDPGTHEPVDLVFLDPPFALTDILPAPLEQPGRLADGALLVFQAPEERLPPNPLGGWTLRESRRYGASVLAIYHRGG